MENLIVLIIAIIGIIVKAKSSDEKKKKQYTYQKPQQPRQAQPQYTQQSRPVQPQYTTQQPRQAQPQYTQQPRQVQPQYTQQPRQVQPPKPQRERYEQWKAAKQSTQGKAMDAMQQLKQQEQENSILERANLNLQEYEGDVESDMLSQVNDRIVTGYSGEMEFERDFIAEGIEMLNSFQVPDSVEQFLTLPEQ
ncbi:MAG: hypothetical protein SPJ65_12295 [Roseburia sp.]|nr:hypothetical protein [Roseburia sp.]